MKKKRTLALLLAFALSASLSTGAIAADSSYVQEQPEKYQLEAGLVANLNDSTVSLNNAETWAYKNYAQATKAEKVNILKARSIMLQSTDWVLDGYTGIYTAPDGTEEVLPTFSEVFPDWDFEQICAYNNEVEVLKETVSISTALQNDYFDVESIPVATSSNAPAQYAANMQGYNNGTTYHDYTTKAMWLTTCTTCNIGYKITYPNMITVDVGFKENIPAGGEFSMNIDKVSISHILVVRVSTWDATGGSGTFNFLVT